MAARSRNSHSRCSRRTPVRDQALEEGGVPPSQVSRYHQLPPWRSPLQTTADRKLGTSAPACFPAVRQTSDHHSPPLRHEVPCRQTSAVNNVRQEPGPWCSATGFPSARVVAAPSRQLREPTRAATTPSTGTRPVGPFRRFTTQARHPRSERPDRPHAVAEDLVVAVLAGVEVALAKGAAKGPGGAFLRRRPEGDVERQGVNG